MNKHITPALKKNNLILAKQLLSGETRVLVNSVQPLKKQNKTKPSAFLLDYAEYYYYLVLGTLYMLCKYSATELPLNPK